MVLRFCGESRKVGQPSSELETLPMFWRSEIKAILIVDGDGLSRLIRGGCLALEFKPG